MKKAVSALIFASLIAVSPVHAQSSGSTTVDERKAACLRIALGFITVQDLIDCEVWA